MVSPLAPVRAGEPITAIVHLYNPSSKTQGMTVALTVDDQPHATQTVTVAAGARMPIPLRLYLTEPGRYDVATQHLATTFELYPASMSVEEQRTVAQGRTRRIIYNNDGSDALYHRDAHTYLDVSTSGLAGSHVDSIFYSTVGGLTFWHDSRVGQFVDRGVADALIKTYGKDALEIQADFARRHGMEIFWSMRMNDTHDKVPQWDWLSPQWKRDHPEWLVGRADVEYEWGGGNWTAVDYSHQETRDYIYDIIEDVVERYPIDGIELDFYRGEPFFKQQLLGQPVPDAARRNMTELVRRIAALISKESKRRDRPFLLAVRVPDSALYARDIGLDVNQWLNDELIDILIVGGDHRYEPWENMVELARKHDRPVYACLAGDYLTQEESDWPARWRGHAKHAWDANVDGIYTFNFLQHEHPLFREMGDPELLKTLDSVYEFTPGTYWGFLPNELDYIHAVRIQPKGGPFVGEQDITLKFPPGGQHEIRYTTDGRDPDRDSQLYKGPFNITDNAIVRARSYAEDGTATPVMQEKYLRVKERFLPVDTQLPVDFFGLPNGSELSVHFNLPEVPAGMRCQLFLSMMDVDNQDESAIYVNGHGPLKPPVEVLSGSMVLDGLLDVPPDYFKTGDNVLTFKFDNLGGGTSGYRVYRVEIVFTD